MYTVLVGLRWPNVKAVALLNGTLPKLSEYPPLGNLRSYSVAANAPGPVNVLFASHGSRGLQRRQKMHPSCQKAPHPSPRCKAWCADATAAQRAVTVQSPPVSDTAAMSSHIFGHMWQKPPSGYAHMTQRYGSVVLLILVASIKTVMTKMIFITLPTPIGEGCSRPADSPALTAPVAGSLLASFCGRHCASPHAAAARWRLRVAASRNASFFYSRVYRCGGGSGDEQPRDMAPAVSTTASHCLHHPCGDDRAREHCAQAKFPLFQHSQPKAHAHQAA